MRAVRAVLMLAVVVLAVGACGSGSSPNPYAGLPSNACGGFHLKVVNQTGSAVRVTLNGTWTTVVAGGGTKTIVESFPPQPPPLPWAVIITDDTSGKQLFTSTMPGPVDQKVTLSAEGPVQSPYDLSEDC